MRGTRLLPTLTALVLGAGLAAAPGAASAGGPAGTVPLQAGSQPEGIASQGTTYWAGARLDGAVYTGSLVKGTRRLLVPGTADHAARGIELDPATRTLWVVGDVRDPAGSAATTSTITAYDADSGALRRRIVVPGQRFLNDVAIEDGVVYVTDSLSAQLVVVRPDGWSLLPLTGDWVQAPAPALGANGIEVLPQGDLLVTDSATGDLFRVRPATGAADRVELTGPALSSGDGLVVRGRTVYVVRGFNTNDIAVVQLTGGSGRVVGRLSDADLDTPTTAVLAAGGLYAVNGRFSTPPTATTPYDLVRVALR